MESVTFRSAKFASATLNQVSGWTLSNAGSWTMAPKTAVSNGAVAGLTPASGMFVAIISWERLRTKREEMSRLGRFGRLLRGCRPPGREQKSFLRENSQNLSRTIGSSNPPESGGWRRRREPGANDRAKAVLACPEVGVTTIEAWPQSNIYSPGESWSGLTENLKLNK